MEYYKILDRYKLVREQQTSNDDPLSVIASLLNIPSNSDLLDIVSKGAIKDIPGIGWVFKMIGSVFPGFGAVTSANLDSFLFGDVISAIASSELTRLDRTGITRIPYLKKALDIYNTDSNNLGNNLILFLGLAAVIYPKIMGPTNAAINGIIKLTPTALKPLVGFFGYLLIMVLYTSPLLVYASTYLNNVYYKDSAGNEIYLGELFEKLVNFLKQKGEEFKVFLIKKYDELKVLKTKHQPDKSLSEFLWSLRNTPETAARYGGPDLMGGRPGGAYKAPERSTRFGQ